MKKCKCYALKVCSMLLFIAVFILLCCSKTSYATELLEVAADVIAEQTVQLKWNVANSEAVYQISRSEDGVTYVPLGTVTGIVGEATYNDSTVVTGGTYYYKVSWISGEQMVAESAAINVFVTLPVPSGLKAKKVKEKKVNLTWEKVDSATGYYIYRSTKSGKGYKKIATTKKTGYVDENVKAGTPYFYRVLSYSKGTPEITTNTNTYVSAFMKPATPGLNGMYNKGKVKLTWKKVKGAKHYYIYKENDEDKYELLGQTTSLNYVDKEIEKGNSYQYRIVASYTVGDTEVKSAKSKTCTVFAADFDPNRKMVALTFDDGPGPYTAEIVDCLKKYNAKATFFVVGSNVNNYKKALKNADKIGCEIGNHTYNHANLPSVSADEIKSQMKKTDDRIEKIIGKRTTIMRTPGGATSQNVKDAVGKPIILWSVDTLDWKTRSCEKTVSCVMKNAKDGDIILMHDIHKPSKEAALILIPKLVNQGYQLVTVSELAQYRNYTMKKGGVYHSFRKKK